MVAQLQHILIRHLAAAVYQTRNLLCQQLVIHLPSALRSHLADIFLLHITDDLNTVLIKMIKKSG